MKLPVLFTIINGDGLGHLTRTLAIAKRIRNLSPDFEVIFYTTCQATEIIKNFGFLCYYIPAIERMPEYLLRKDWEAKVQLQLEKILELHHPRIVVFDGAYPSTAILTPLMRVDKIKKLWIKREGDRSNMLKLDVYEKYFDAILVPIEVGLEYKETSPKKQYLSPILLLDNAEGYDRKQVREIYRIHKEKRFWYIQLGNDGTYDNKEDVAFIIKCLLQNKNNVILFGESIRNTSQKIEHERVITIGDYPNSRFFKGLDCAVSAAGYNTFHELLSFKVPSIFIPNRKIVKDDQVARAKRAQELNVGIALTDTRKFFEALVRFEDHYEEFHSNLELVQFKNGALQAAEFIYQQIK